MTCDCGCKRPARWLCTGPSPEGGFIDLPCCDTAADYLSECCADLELPFKRRPVDT